MTKQKDVVTKPANTDYEKLGRTIPKPQSQQPAQIPNQPPKDKK